MHANPGVATGAPAPPTSPLPPLGGGFVRARDPSIETLRGVAVILMVLGHVIGDSFSSGLHVAEDSLYRYWYFSSSSLRMPLFTVISGFVYAMRPMQPGNLGRFLRGKARRLLVPLLVVGTAQFVLKGLIPGVNHSTNLDDLWRAHLYGFDQFWFLQALLVVFLTVAILEEFEIMAGLGGWLLCFASAVLASRFLPKLEFFSLWGYLYLLPYFLLGCGIVRFGSRLDRFAIVALAAALVAAGLAVQQRRWFLHGNLPEDDYSWTSLAVGLGGTFLLVRFRPTIAWLAALGAYAFSIYLFHVFFTAASRIALKRLAIDQQEILLLVGLAFGLLGPVGAVALVQSMTGAWQRRRRLA